MKEGQAGMSALCCRHSGGATPSGSSLSVSHTLALVTTALLRCVWVGSAGVGVKGVWGWGGAGAAGLVAAMCTAQQRRRW
jgi:hypothetical protein